MWFRAAVFGVLLTLSSGLWSGCQRQPAQVDDAAIVKTVRAKLHAQFGPIEHREERQMERGADQQIIAYIDVSCSNGTVTLTGEAPGNRAKKKAEEIAKSISGVTNVINQLGVAPGYSDDAVGSDGK
jgi:osmotically-inducible protein OsmY